MSETYRSTVSMCLKLMHTIRLQHESSRLSSEELSHLSDCFLNMAAYVHRCRHEAEHRGTRIIDGTPFQWDRDAQEGGMG